MKSYWTFTKLFSGLISREAAVGYIVLLLFPTKWLCEADPDTPGKNRQQVMTLQFIKTLLVARPQTAVGRFGHLSAVMTHHVSPSRLQTLATKVRPISIITGDDDNLVNPIGSEDLHKNMPGSRLTIRPGNGHAIPSQDAEYYNRFIDQHLRDAGVGTN